MWVSKEGILTNEDVSAYKDGMLEEFSSGKYSSFNQEGFYQAELFIKKTYPDCGI